jgi:hypothetical protein
VLGIVGAFVATYLGQAVGWYKAGEGAGFVGAIVGAIIILVVWGIIVFEKRYAQAPIRGDRPCPAMTTTSDYCREKKHPGTQTQCFNRTA